MVWAALESFTERHKMQMAQDGDGAPVFLYKSAWEVGYAEEKFPNIRFARTKERVV